MHGGLFLVQNFAVASDRNLMNPSWSPPAETIQSPPGELHPLDSPLCLSTRVFDFSLVGLPVENLDAGQRFEMVDIVVSARFRRSPADGRRPRTANASHAAIECRRCLGSHVYMRGVSTAASCCPETTSKRPTCPTLVRPSPEAARREKTAQAYSIEG